MKELSDRDHQAGNKGLFASGLSVFSAAITYA